MLDKSFANLGYRVAFTILLLVTVVLGYKIYPSPTIDTDLVDVTPKSLNKAQSDFAISHLQDYAQKRVFILLSASDEDAVYDAEFELREDLAAIAQIQLLPNNEALFEQLVEGLVPFRFSMLSNKQEADLGAQTVQEIADNAVTRLYQSDTLPSSFGFNRDPLFWHNETLFNVLKKMRLVPDVGAEQLSATNEPHALVSFTIKEGALNVDKQEELLLRLSTALESIEQHYAINTERSGVFFFAADAAKKAKADISTISIGSSIGIALLLLFAFGQLRLLLLPALSVSIGIGFAFVVSHSLYGNVHVLTIVFGASLIGVVIDYSLHYFYHQANAHDAVHERTPLHNALLLSLITSLIGYASLSFSSLEALQKVAVFSCCGLVAAWLCVLSFGGSFNTSLAKTKHSVFESLVLKLSKFTSLLPRSASLPFGLMAICLALVVVIKLNPFSDSPRVFFQPSSVLLASEAKVAAVANDFEPGRYVLIHGNSASQIHHRYSTLIDSIRTQTRFKSESLSSLLDWLPSEAMQQTTYKAQAKLYGREGALDAFAKKIEGASGVSVALEDEYKSASNRLLTAAHVKQIIGDSLPPFWIEGSAKNGDDPIIYNFVLIRKGSNPDELVRATKSLEGVEYINSIERTEHALREQRQSALSLLLLAYLLIALVLLIRYRSFESLWMLLVPACSSSLVVLICFGAGISLNLFHIMALFLVLGFGMDYTIFTKELGKHPAITLPAILLSALTSLLSFGLLSLSSIPIIQSFGFTLLIGNSFNLLATFIASNHINKQNT